MLEDVTICFHDEEIRGVNNIKISLFNFFREEFISLYCFNCIKNNKDTNRNIVLDKATPPRSMLDRKSLPSLMIEGDAVFKTSAGVGDSVSKLSAGVGLSVTTAGHRRLQREPRS